MRCTAPGIGSPPLCSRHFIIAAEDVYDDGPTISELLAHPFVQDLMDKVLSHADAWTAPRPAASPGRGYAAQCPPAPGPTPTSGPRDWERRHTPPPPSPPPSPAAEDPLVVLGFGPRQRPTREQIKKRQRDLAILCHPDRPDGAGDTEAMQRINAAADALLSQVG